jgi:hypothetical protein
MYLKAALFFLIAITSGVLLLAPDFSLRALLLLALLVWSACRAYYFLFYVLERYIDPDLKYSGLLAQLRQLARKL